jgi:hypothetical protein
LTPRRFGRTFSPVSDLNTTSGTLTDTPFALVTRWKAEGVPRAQWLERLVAGGLDRESAQVIANSIDGASPSRLPEASFSQGTNPLAPGAFALTDLGLQGNPATVGFYWLAFGAAVLLMFGLFALLMFLDVVQQPPVALLVTGRVMGTIGALALLRGAWQVVGAVTVRRREP